MARIAESHVEEAALDWFEELGWTVLHGPDIAPDEPAAERESYSHVILRERLECAIDSLNPTLPAQAKQEALRKALRNYTEGTGAQDIAYDQREAVAIMLEKLHFAPFAEEHIIQQAAEFDDIREHGLALAMLTHMLFHLVWYPFDIKFKQVELYATYRGGLEG